MTIIKASDLVKEFRQHKRFSGPFGTIRTLFTQEYTTHRAVDHVSFEIEAGEAVGYVGPNGAGKSTTIKTLTGILVPTSGEVLVNGRVPHEARRENARHIGVVFGQRSQLWWDLPVIDSFDLHRHMYDIPVERYHRNMDYCEDVLRMREFIGQPVRQLSLGQRMRAELAMALLHEPEVLFLDEPTIGLDILAKDRILEFLRTLVRERKTTIILTTHDLKEIEEICPRIIVINSGRILYDGSVAALKAQVGNQRTIVVDFEHDPGMVEISGAELVRDEGIRKQYQFDRASVSTFEVMGRLADKYPISDVSIEETSIEQVIRDLYEPNVQGRADIDTEAQGRVTKR